MVVSLTGMPRRIISRSDGASADAVAEKPDNPHQPGGSPREWGGELGRRSAKIRLSHRSFRHRQRVIRTRTETGLP